MKIILQAVVALTLIFSSASFAAENPGPPHDSKPQGEHVQYAAFPKPLYSETKGGVLESLKERARAEPFNVVASGIFLLAILHTFKAGFFTKLAHRFEKEHKEMHADAENSVSFKASLFHFLGEVEAIFGIWVFALAAAATYYYSWNDFVLYIGKDCVFTEPLFVVVIMAIASSRPVLRFAESLMSKTASIGKGSPTAWWLSVLIIAPVLGSFITEPAAMTIGALLLAKKFYRFSPPPMLAYGTLGLLFVNISVGGTLTHFAAPPVLMVAAKWGWNTPYMFVNFGWKALVAIVLSTFSYYLFFKKELFRLSDLADGCEDGLIQENWNERLNSVPWWVTLIHLIALAWTVYAAHYPALFIGGFLFYIAFTAATKHHQNPISLRSPILVGFFLAGLVVHGGCQAWWIAPVLSALDDKLILLGSAVLTSFNDNAAITYLASQVQNLSLGAKHAVVAGAITGGGLTVIANAPNPAGQSILSKFFKNNISPLGLFLGALIPTVIVYFCFLFLPSASEKEIPVSADTPMISISEKINAH